MVYAMGCPSSTILIRQSVPVAKKPHASHSSSTRCQHSIVGDCAGLLYNFHEWWWSLLPWS
jgi:hypothetical protein